MLLWFHHALLAAAAIFFALASFYALRALTGRPHRARRAARAGAVGFAFALADALGRMPIAYFSAEQSGDVNVFAATTMSLLVLNGVPTVLWGLALFARWRGWLADVVFAAAVLIAAAVTLPCYWFAI